MGLGRSGLGVAKLLKAEGHQAIIIEKNDNPELRELAKGLGNEGIYVALKTPLEISSFNPWLEKLSKVIISPGISWDHPTLNALRKQGISIESEISFAWARLNKFPWIGITGTNGKTTVTYLINHILEKNGFIAPMGGNMGFPASSIALNLKKKQTENPDYLIIELSSYQIEASPQIQPFIGIWTSFSPDHLERHKSIESYRDIKKSLLDKSKIKIFNSDDIDLNHNRSNLGEGIWVSSKTSLNNNYWINKEGIIVEGDKELFDSSILDMPGDHNLQNLLLATAAAREIGVSPERIKESILSFKGLPHRLENITEINGIKIINDSKATNYDAAATGLKAIPKPAIVLAGGKLKQGNPKEWLIQINRSACDVILFGEGAEELDKILKESNYQGNISRCLNMNEAIKIAKKIIIQDRARSIILSPAAASFDQYKDFEDRGNHFREIIIDESKRWNE